MYIEQCHTSLDTMLHELVRVLPSGLAWRALLGPPAARASFRPPTPSVHARRGIPAADCTRASPAAGDGPSAAQSTTEAGQVLGGGAWRVAQSAEQQRGDRRRTGVGAGNGDGTGLVQ